MLMQIDHPVKEELAQESAITDGLLSSLAYNLVRYNAKEQNPLDDAVEEIAQVLNVELRYAKELTEKVMDWYHYKISKKYPSDITPDVMRVIVHITQSFRLPEMTTRMDEVIKGRDDWGLLRTVLDYGGGGGKDSIIFSRLGYKTTYTDILGDITPYIRKRFDIRQLDIEVTDVTQLGERRFDVINCMDVIEHVYDVEYVVADIISRLNVGGHLVCYPCFYNSWDGDHIEKNCGYRPYFIEMLLRVGMTFASPSSEESPGWLAKTKATIKRETFLTTLFKNRLGILPCEAEVYHLIRTKPITAPVSEERQAFSAALYALSKRFSMATALISLVLLAFCALFGVALLPIPRYRRLVSKILNRLFDNIIDNFAIWRLSVHRLTQDNS